jgi:hypothetical protein
MNRQYFWGTAPSRMDWIQSISYWFFTSEWSLVSADHKLIQEIIVKAGIMADIGRKNRLFYLPRFGAPDWSSAASCTRGGS